VKNGICVKIRFRCVNAKWSNYI